jgi:hypothetical protein
MPAQFITLDDKMKIYQNIEDKKVKDFVINELQRLESIIKDYEVVLPSAHERYIGKSFNNPK